jgi:biopolymer transport protein ExbB
LWRYTFDTQKKTAMKKLFAILLLTAGLMLTGNQVALAQEKPAAPVTQTDSNAAPAEEVVAPAENAEAPAAEKSGHRVLVEKFIEGDPVWMAPVLLCLILGLAIAIERIISLNMASINTNKFLGQVEDALKTKGIEGAKEVCRNTRGPVASIFYQGLDRSEEGLEIVEKSVVSYGSVQMGQLERGLVWISLFIALAPMLGFLGTVVGMVQSFDAIEKAGDISATIVAGGIKVALLTTIGGLVVAIILQLFYNYLVSKIDSLVNTMEDASITLIDMLIKSKVIK